MSEPVFPFKFNVVDETYTANLLPDNNVLIVCDTTGEQYFSYSKEIILEHIRLGNWQMLPANKKEQDPEVTIRQSEVDAYIDEINMLRELVAELTTVKEGQQFEQQFKPISEMTLEDWQQAKEGGWEFETLHKGTVTVHEVSTYTRDSVPLLLENARGNTWYIGLDGTDVDNEGWTIVKRVK
jgi:hypothetical protein